MDPYQAWRRGLISTADYEEQKRTRVGNISPSSTLNKSVVMTGFMNLNENEVWAVEDGETAMALIGPTHDLINEGSMDIAGDVVFLCLGDKGIDSTSGDINITGDGTLRLMDLSDLEV